MTPVRTLHPRSLAALTTLAAAAFSAATGAAQTGAVYVMTNDRQANEIVVYDRDESGRLTFDRRVPTGGRGSGGTIDPLGSQGSLILSRDGSRLFAVNARSRELSVLDVGENGLELVETVRSRGTFPVSLTAFDDLLYVLHALGTPNVRGFRIRRDGSLRSLGGSRRVLVSGVSPNGLASHPVQVEFSPSGEQLVVSDLDTDELHVFGVEGNGRPSAAAEISPSAGGGPFGFTFSRGRYLVVSELRGRRGGEIANAGAASSYAIGRGGRVEPLSRSVENFQTATCWILGDGGRHVFTTNTSSSTLTAYRVRRNGRLRRLPANGVTYRFPRSPRRLPIDLAVTPDGSYLYTLNAGTGSIGMFAIKKSGRLTFLGEQDGLPANAGIQGIAAR